MYIKFQSFVVWLLINTACTIVLSTVDLCNYMYIQLTDVEGVIIAPLYFEE